MNLWNALHDWTEQLTPDESTMESEARIELDDAYRKTINNILRLASLPAAGLSLFAAFVFGFFAPNFNRWYGMANMIALATICLVTHYLARKNSRLIPYAVMLGEVVFPFGLALMMVKTVQSGLIGMNDLMMLSSLYLVVMIFSILIFPFGHGSVLIIAILQVIMGAAGWYTSGDVVIEAWTTMLVSAAGLAVFLYYALHFFFRSAQVANWRARGLREQNEKLKLESLEKDLTLARQLQDSFAPPQRWEDERGYVVEFFQQKFDILGGDWIACRRLASGDLVILVVDATGKGIQASLIIHAVQSLWAHSMDEQTFDPLHWIQAVNTTLWRLGGRSPHTLTLGLTLLSGTTLSYYSAGHIPLFLIGSDASQKTRVTPVLRGGSILGMNEKCTITPAVLELGPLVPEAILIGTDGVFDKPTLLTRDAVLDFYSQLQTHGAGALAALNTPDDKMLAIIHFRERFYTAMQAKVA